MAHDAADLIETFFTSRKKLLAYFEVRAPLYDYDYEDARGDDWAVVQHGGKLVRHLQVPEDWTVNDVEGGWTYSGDIDGVYEGEEFSLVLVDVHQGGSGVAYILDNSMRKLPPWEA